MESQQNGPDAGALAPRIVCIALVLGALGDALLRAAPWGLNLALWLLALAGAILLLAGWLRGGRREGTNWQIGLIAVAALLLAWRDAGALKALDLLAVLAALAATALRVSAARLHSLTLLDASLAALASALHAALGAGTLLWNELPWQETGLSRGSRHALATARGVMLGVPLLLLFGSLFASADAAFAGLAGRLLHLDLGAALSHVCVVALLAWLTAGFLRGALVAGSVPLPSEGARQSLALVADDSLRLDPLADSTLRRIRQAFAVGGIEIGVVLGLLDALFLSFVAVQFRYFFGGAALVETSATLTYAEYARRGFFELVAAVALVLPLLLTLDWLRPPDAPRSTTVFRLLACALLALVAVVVVSAVQRMRLYEAAYGLTEPRLYATAFMGWIALVLLWLATTVLRGDRDRFAFGAAACALLVLLTLNALNPSALIVRLNADRARTGRPFDTAYATSLGADAVPQLLATLPALPADERCQVAGDLLQNWSGPRGDWRTWNLGREQALRAIQAHRNVLLELPCR